MSGEFAVPALVIEIWRWTLAVTLLVFIPWAVYLLHSGWRAARSIQLSARDARVAAEAIAANTRHVAALDATAATGGGLLNAAGAVDAKLATLADALAERAR